MGEQRFPLQPPAAIELMHDLGLVILGTGRGRRSEDVSYYWDTDDKFGPERLRQSNLSARNSGLSDEDYQNDVEIRLTPMKLRMTLKAASTIHPAR